MFTYFSIHLYMVLIFILWLIGDYLASSRHRKVNYSYFIIIINYMQAVVPNGG